MVTFSQPTFFAMTTTISIGNRKGWVFKQFHFRVQDYIMNYLWRYILF